MCKHHKEFLSFDLSNEVCWKDQSKKLDKIKIIVDDEEVDLNSKKHEIKTEDGYHYVGEFDSENN